MCSIHIRRGELPREVSGVMKENEQRHDYENPAYLEAQIVFNKTFVRREERLPLELLPAFRNLSEDKTVYETM